MKKILTWCFCGLALLGKAQNITFEYNNTIKIIQNNQTLANAWAGGLNAPQFSTCRLNNDAYDDLVVYDRTAQKLSTFLATKDSNGQWQWTHAPEYETQFPTIQNWILLIDYDHDGKKDIFTHAQAGLKIYKNIGTDKLAWQLIANPVYTLGFSGTINLNVTATDIPAIVDCDNDGDIDVLVFDTSGNFVEFHRNYGVEKYNDPNRLEFVKIGYCWGNFLKEHCKDFRFDIDCGDTPAGGNSLPIGLNTTASPNKVLHSGNTLLLVDLNGDNKKDVLFGHISCTNIAAMLNEGTERRAIFKQVSYSYPQSDPIDFPIFPAVYYEDLDFDGIKDLVAAPNGFDNAQQTIDFQNVAWMYKNTGQSENPTWRFQGKDFLVNTMVDLGENAAPVLVDIDGDNDLDLLVGNGGIRGTQGYRASIYLYENQGNGSFVLKNTDYLGISSALQLFDIRPFVSDMNGDGVNDLGFSSNSFKGVEVRYIPNKGARGKTFDLQLNNVVLLPSIPDVVAGESITFVDVDKDGNKDVIHGTSLGRLRYLRNKGSNTNPSYQLENDNLGGVDDLDSEGTLYVTTADLNLDGKLELITGTRAGHLIIYKSFLDQNQSNYQADTSLIWDNNLTQYAKLLLGGNASIATGDLDNDFVPDLVVGTNTGGLRFLKGKAQVIITDTDKPLLQRIFPNPTSGYVYFTPTQAGTIKIIDIQGKTVINAKSVQPNIESSIDLSGLATGTYIFQFESSAGQLSNAKVMVVK